MNIGVLTRNANKPTNKLKKKTAVTSDRARSEPRNPCSSCIILTTDCQVQTSRPRFSSSTPSHGPFALMSQLCDTAQRFPPFVQSPQFIEFDGGFMRRWRRVFLRAWGVSFFLGQTPGPDSRAILQGQTPEPDSRARHQGQTSAPDTRARLQGQTQGPDSRAKLQSQTTEPDTSARHQGQTLGPDIRARHQGQTPGPYSRAKLSERTRGTSLKI